MRVGQLLAEPGIDRTAWLIVECAPTMVIAVDTHTYEVYRWTVASLGHAILVDVRALAMQLGDSGRGTESYWRAARRTAPPAVLAHLRGDR